jgi:hypothetical protein
MGRGEGKGMGGHQSSTMINDSWFTPIEILQALGEFDLDPCTSHSRPWNTAKRHFALPEQNGLALPWEGRVWLNPPYGRDTGTWLKKMVDHGNGIALIFARTETEDWHEHIWKRSPGILFLRGRLTFYLENGKRAAHNSGAPSALVSYGQENLEVLLKCGLPGALVLASRIVELCDTSRSQIEFVGI